MFEELMSDVSALARHRTGPLVKERELFLRYLRTCGTGRENIRTTACYLLQIIRLLNLRQLRNVSPDEIDRASDRWLKRRHRHRTLRAGRFGKQYFGWTARRWLRFAGRFKAPRPSQPFKVQLFAYVQAMKTEKGFSEATVKGRRFRAEEFLRWFARKHRPFQTIRIDDVDSYLFRDGSSRGPVTIKTESGALRAFFRCAEARGWCTSGIADSIKGPLLHHDPFEAQGPKWSDVVYLLRSTQGSSNRADIRAHALLRLFAIYGLRNSEAHRLQLKDIDWTNKTIIIRRAKREGLQLFPLHDGVAHAIRRYVDEARPSCQCPTVFVTINGPYRPLIQNTVSAIVRSRMLRCGIESKHCGPQALRHACATRLLSLGASLSEIADFLGHRNDKTVQVYARLDAKALDEVSAIDLAGAL